MSFGVVLLFVQVGYSSVEVDYSSVEVYYSSVEVQQPHREVLLLRIGVF